MRILIAEDDVPLATVIAQAFKPEGHVIEIACNGEDALQRMQKEQFDFLILDLNLPIISGSEVLHKVRSGNPDIPILILTATDEVEERVACLDARRRRLPDQAVLILRALCPNTRGAAAQKPARASISKSGRSGTGLHAENGASAGACD